MRQPPEYIWLWLVKGFDGLFGMIEKWLTLGVPVTDELRNGLRDVDSKLKALMERVNGSL